MSATSVSPDSLALQRLYHWERTAPEQVVLTQPLGGGALREFTWRETLDQTRRMAAHLKSQGAPDYLDAITIDEDEETDGDAGAAGGDFGSDEGADLYDRAVNIVLRDRKCSVSYIQRRLSVGYNKAASLVERMEKEGVVSAPNHAGKREILVGGGIDRGAFDIEAAE